MIVVHPLTHAYHVVIVVITKLVHEFVEDLVLSHLARYDLWMLGGGIDASQIIFVNCATPILIKLRKGGQTSGFACLIHRTTYTVEEFIQIKDAVTIFIEQGKQL